ncbi:hypothetical protein [Novosphingobium beihaiensis]|uniref:Swt1-like HEPN domain-containing protein n=1 Tax=Novosphingobium beihaiensis TaxID=2930389 RepID=A0ABT0BVF1_9SPHN|nr:hypothetical protein [Novosphingobium beihaiensis]MCJ2189026.1 hypothetical protein [Novosphingobium beihaiensis]
MNDKPTLPKVSRVASEAMALVNKLERERVLDVATYGAALPRTLRAEAELSRVSEAYRNIVFAKKALASLCADEVAAGGLGRLKEIGAFSVIEQVRSQHEAMMQQLTGSMSARLLARQREFLAPYERVNSHIALLMKSFQGAKVHLAMPSFVSISKEIAALTKPYSLPTGYASNLADHLAGITKPWTAVGHETASIAAAVRLSQFATFSRELPAFSKERYAVTATEFGSFDRLRPLAEPLEDEEEAEEVYTEGGRAPSLVAFPSESYDDVLSATGWVFDIRSPAFVRPDGSTLPNANIDPRDHFIISMVECHLKAIISAALISGGGMAALERLFGNRLPAWKSKRDIAVERDEPELHLVYYADFMEIAEIILNKELWASTFKAVFRNRERFKHSIERLHGLRVPTSHSRPLTRTGKLRLMAEALELFEAIGVVPRQH